MTATSAGATTAGRAQVTVKVGGMHCALCAGIVERELDGQPGVGPVRISLPEREVVVDYDPGRVSEDQLRAAVAALGFDLGDTTSRNGQQPDEDDAKIVEEGRRLLTLAVLSTVTVPLMLFELLAQTGVWVEWVLAGLAATSLVVSPELYRATVQTRLRGLLQNRPVVRASAFGGLAGGLVGLLFGLEDFPTGGFFAATVGPRPLAGGNPLTSADRA
jgi:Cu+-exporting ATPase